MRIMISWHHKFTRFPGLTRAAAALAWRRASAAAPAFVLGLGTTGELGELVVGDGALGSCGGSALAACEEELARPAFEVCDDAAALAAGWVALDSEVAVVAVVAAVDAAVDAVAMAVMAVRAANALAVPASDGGAAFAFFEGGMAGQVDNGRFVIPRR